MNQDHKQLTPATIRKAIIKARILEGTSHRHPEPIPELAEAGPPYPVIVLRPVTDSEVARSRAVMLRHMQLPDGTAIEDLKAGRINMGELELGGMTEGKTWSDYELVAAAIVPAEGEDHWTADDVANLPPGVPARLAKIVRRISGLSEEGQADAEAFRPQ